MHMYMHNRLREQLDRFRRLREGTVDERPAWYAWRCYIPPIRGFVTFHRYICVACMEGVCYIPPRRNGRTQACIALYIHTHVHLHVHVARGHDGRAACVACMNVYRLGMPETACVRTAVHGGDKHRCKCKCKCKCMCTYMRMCMCVYTGVRLTRGRRRR